MSKEKLTEEDINSIKYIWKEKENLECWVDWEIKQHLIIKELPLLYKAWNDYKMSIKMLNLIVEDLN